MLSLVNLLKDYGFDQNCSFKLVRHSSEKISIEELIRNNLFEDYQCIQPEDYFKCDYIISFVGKGTTKALFWGVYKVKKIEKINAKIENTLNKYKEEFPNDNLNEKYFYTLEKQNGYKDLEQRVIIDWGKGVRRWVQNKCDKNVIEIKPEGFVMDFDSYYKTVLSFSELERIFKNSDANFIWKNKLSSVSGIYLILDTKTGKQYIGSACGKNGIWGRWEEYIKTGAGGNILLKELLKKNNDYKYNFQFTILQTLPSNLKKDEVNDYETLYKKKLGSRAFGLNEN